jgi:hypothetical protein
MAVYSIPSAITPAKVASAYQVAQPITPADNTRIGSYQGFLVGVSGNVTVVMANGDGNGGVTPVTIAAVAGFIYPLVIQGVNATGTTATGIVGLG